MNPNQFPQHCAKYVTVLETQLAIAGVAIKTIGQTLHTAWKDIGKDALYLEEFLQDRGFSEGDIKAAKLVAKGDLDDRLVWMGVPSTRIIKLNKVDQQRLLSNEEFEVKDPDAPEGFIRVTWRGMLKPQRKQLIGYENGEAVILEWRLQKLKEEKRKPPKPLVFEHLEYSVTKKRLELETQGFTSTITARELYLALMKQGTNDEFIAELVRMNDLLGKLAS